MRKIDKITNKRDKWYATFTVDGKTSCTKEIYPLDDFSYGELACRLFNDFNILLPPISEAANLIEVAN